MGPSGGMQDRGSFFTMLYGSPEHSKGQVSIRSMDETTLTKNKVSEVWDGPFSLSKSSRSSWRGTGLGPGSGAAHTGCAQWVTGKTGVMPGVRDHGPWSP